MNCGKIVMLGLLTTLGACAATPTQNLDAMKTIPQPSAIATAIPTNSPTPQSIVTAEQVNVNNSTNTSDSVPIKERMPYKEARQLLIEQEWKPNPQAKRPIDRSVQELLDLGYTEIEDCSGSRDGSCQSKFVNGKGELLIVVSMARGNDNTKRFIRRWWIDGQKSLSNNQVTQSQSPENSLTDTTRREQVIITHTDLFFYSKLNPQFGSMRLQSDTIAPGDRSYWREWNVIREVVDRETKLLEAVCGENSIVTWRLADYDDQSDKHTSRSLDRIATVISDYRSAQSGQRLTEEASKSQWSEIRRQISINERVACLIQ